MNLKKTVPALVIAGCFLGSTGVAGAGTTYGGGRADQPAGHHDAWNPDENPGTRYFRADLNPLNHSRANGVVKLAVTGTTLRVHIDASGLAPNLVHAQHIHGSAGTDSTCPQMRKADTNHDGILTVSEGAPFYGPIENSLTTMGGTSPAEALAVELFPVADSHGDVTYDRTFEIKPEVAANLADFHIVQHGVDLNANRAYDFGAGPSELNPALPQEATAPADCGIIHPTGGHHH